ncbi:MAG: hypothetical protein ACK5OX_10585 [Desertimonas sp.]
MLLTTIVLASLLGAAPPTDTSEAVPAGETTHATETVAATAVGAGPLAVLNALLTTPFPTDELPVSFADAQLEAWLDYDDDDLATAIGGTALEAVGADPDGQGSGLFYVVYGTAEAAQAYVDATLDIDDTDDTDTDTDTDTEGFCVEIVATVLVAVSTTADDGRACDVAQVAIGHLESLTAVAATATDRPESGAGEVGPLQRLNALVDDTDDTELIAYDDSRVVDAIGGVELTAIDGPATTSVLVFRSDTQADAWLLDGPLGAEVVDRQESGNGDRQVSFELEDGVGCAASRGLIVILATAADDATHDPCDAVADGASVVEALAPG